MDEKKPGNPWTKSLLIWVGILFGLVLFVQMVHGPSASAGQPIPYSEFIRQVDEGSVKSVTIASSPTGNSTISGKMNGGEDFRTTAPADAQFVTALQQGEELGAPIVDTLVSLAKDMRRTDAQNARRKAARAVPKATMMITTFMVPATMILLGAGLILGSGIDLGAVTGE